MTDRAEELAAGLFPAAVPGLRRFVDLLRGPGLERGLLGPREADRLWDRHVLNSLALADLVPAGAATVDVGSGAGLPGIPLALARPDLAVTLLEPLLRRSVFLQEAVEVLALADRVAVVRARAEEHRQAYAAVVARAVAPLDRLVTWCAPLRSRDGVVLALKGRGAAAEVEVARVVLRTRRLRADVVERRLHPELESTVVVRVTSADGGATG